MTDEYRDVSGAPHLSIVTRFAPNSNNCTIARNCVRQEYFLAFIPLAKFDAASLANKIVDLLNYWKISLES
ncbi:unnamed protein product, partial [Rotaria socialis]